MASRLIRESEGYELLKSIGIPVPRYHIAQTAREAVLAAQEIGYPVVLKIVSPDISHKSDVKGVVTSVKNDDEVRQSFEKIMAGVRESRPDAQVAGIIVEQQLPQGLELIIGGKSDPSFGEILMFGIGGKFVDLIKDVSLRILPLEEHAIREMVQELYGYKLIHGYRDEPPLDEKALIDTLVKISAFFYKNPHIVEFDINPFVLYEHGGCAVDARFILDEDPKKPVSRVHNEIPAELFDAGTIAVVGASADPGKVGYAVCKNLLSFPGTLVPVNPNKTEILGKATFSNLTSIPGNVDIAVITIPARGIPAIVEEAGIKGIPLLVIISSGFREAGDVGRVLEEQVLGIARKYNTRIIGPNCLGIMFPYRKINTTFDPISPKPGKLAFISQSGAVITTLVDWSLSEDIGFSAVISVGNQLDLGFEEYINLVGEDDHTRVIILYIEEIRDGPRFMEVVSKVTPKKPVIAIKSGSSRKGKKAAASHTGSLAGSHDVYLAAFQQAGMITVRSTQQAFHVGELLASEGYPKGKRAIAITSAGGFGVLASDYAELYGIELIELSPALRDQLNTVLPQSWNHDNPMDILGDANAGRFAKVFDILIDNQRDWDIIFIIIVPSALADPVLLAEEVVRFSQRTKKMIVGCMAGGDSMKKAFRILKDNNIPNFQDMESAFEITGMIIHNRY
ncbi:acetate--CoA ligase family protein [uncultured Methanoregula sp.]|uniref:acetate--CoA ligase family protein n=1 Tax=uncultured Methanoregula sp. TaxID=1005933 RepID=UPI002AAB6A4B|nr:acetate--CoA ligase family protein [uncultured Methanoregula sp.]